jgi:hypothetical protein
MAAPDVCDGKSAVGESRHRIAFQVHPLANRLNLALDVVNNNLLCGTEGDLRIVDSHTVPADGRIRSGQSATLQWRVTCTVSDCAISLQGGTDIWRSLPSISTTNYTLTATGGGASDSRSVWETFTGPAGYGTVPVVNCSDQMHKLHFFVGDISGW